MSVALIPGAGGLPKLVLSHPSGSTAEVYLHGAHITSWIPAGGAEALFLSRAAVFEPGKGIRGGIPVIFPQFAGLGPLPKHGFARTSLWQWKGPEDGPQRSTRATLELRDSSETRAVWPHAFLAEITVDLSEHRLAVGLSVRNTGETSFSFTSALHTYFRLADVRRAAVEGLQGLRYVDKTADGAERIETEPEVTVSGETDRVYLNAPAGLRVHDRAGSRTVQVRATGFADAVVWNPWGKLAASLADMGDDEYLRMICVEAAQVGEPIRLQPGEAWLGVQEMNV